MNARVPNTAQRRFSTSPFGSVHNRTWSVSRLINATVATVATANGSVCAASIGHNKPEMGSGDFSCGVRLLFKRPPSIRPEIEIL